MSVGTLARYTPISGPRVPVKVVATGHTTYAYHGRRGSVSVTTPVYVVEVTSRPTGSAHRKGERIVVSLGSPALAVR